MKSLHVIVFLFICNFYVLSVAAQDTAMHEVWIPDSGKSDSAMNEAGSGRDSVNSAHDPLASGVDSAYRDSINRHWMGWKKYQVQRNQSYTLNSRSVLKGRSKKELQYNIADFYLYLNGQIVSPPKTGFPFFAAACLGFKYDDTLLLNSGLGFKVGVGVGIKIVQGRFTSALHANKHNTQVYKFSKNDSVYLKTVTVLPTSQVLKLKSKPDYSPNEIITGEYQATYRKFYEKNAHGEDQVRLYTVRIVFRCRVTGGIDSMKSLSATRTN